MWIGFCIDAFGSKVIVIVLSDNDAFKSSNGVSFLFFGVQFSPFEFVETVISFGKSELIVK